jgi:hypothetical protein
MTQDLFVETILALKKQTEHDRKFAKKISKLFTDCQMIGYNNDVLIEQMVKVLAELTRDKGDWIGYYVWELNFGDEWLEGAVMVGGKDIKLQTPTDLWNLLQMERLAKN